MPRSPVHEPSRRPSTARPARPRPGSVTDRRPTVGLGLAACSTGALTWLLGRRAVAVVGGETVAEVRATWTAPGVRVEDLLELLAVLAATGVAAWFTLGLAVAAACAVARSADRVWLAGERWVHRAAPAVVRRALLASAGTGLALAGALPAAALTPPPDDLGWTVTADRTPAAALAPPPPPPASAVPTSSPVAAAAQPADVPVRGAAPVGAEVAATGGAGPLTVTVEPGDTLWGIALDHLPDGATTTDVATAWPTWYAANAAVVGPDPDLIRPGQRLVAPSATVAAADGADR